MISTRTGLGPLETTVLATLAEMDARPGRPHRKSATVIDATTPTGFSRRYVYEVMCELASEWKVVLPLVDGHGNFGSSDPHDRPANPRYTEARLTFVGALAADAEAEIAPPVPIDLVNGDSYKGGRRPSFHPALVIAAMHAAIRGAPARELAEVVGVPVFPRRCAVDGEIDALLAGHDVTLTYTAVLERRADGAIEITNFPPGSSPETVGAAIAERVNNESLTAEYPELREKTSLFLRDVRNESVSGRDVLVCISRAGADIDEVRRRLLGVWGVRMKVQASLGAPIAELLRQWVDRHGPDATTAGIQRLDDAMRQDADRS